MFIYSFKEVLRTITHSKATCIQFLQKNGCIPTSMLCPGPVINGNRGNYCGKNMAIKKVSDRKDGLSWRCRSVHKYMKKGLEYTVKDVKVSIRQNTWLKDANLTLEEIVELLYLWANGFTISEIEHELKISHRTIVEWTMYFREACTTLVMESGNQIGGPGVHVEIDESKFGKRKYYRGHKVEGQWVFGGRETKDTRKVFMIPVANRKKTTLLPLIEKWIAKGSIIHSDCWKAYGDIGKMGYTHLTVNHSKEFLNKETGACTNSIESDWRHAKVSIPRYGVHKSLHYGYLGEFMWRRKYSDEDKFITLLQHLNWAFHKGYCTSAPPSLK